MKINLSESKLRHIISESIKKVLNEVTARRTDKYTIKDIDCLCLTGDGEIDAQINGKNHPINIMYNVRESRINPMGMSYASWIDEVYWGREEELEWLIKNGMDVNNPPKPGYYYVYKVTKNILYIEDDNGAIYPFYGYDVYNALYPGGELHKVPPTKFTDIFKITAIGEYV